VYLLEILKFIHSFFIYLKFFNEPVIKSLTPSFVCCQLLCFLCSLSLPHLEKLEKVVEIFPSGSGGRGHANNCQSLGILTLAMLPNNGNNQSQSLPSQNIYRAIWEFFLHSPVQSFIWCKPFY
jgi:hypothetical protein